VKKNEAIKAIEVMYNQGKFEEYILHHELREIKHRANGYKVEQAHKLD